ncbi:MAG TPA: hypothetical protein VK472_08000 [Allosphingosinicella sp.]|jgi:hypothetical protein|nr:hypothetical protein [Allosphingosinicella sp.]
MTDPDRDREPLRESERTTIITSDGDRGRGGGAIIAVVVILAVLILLFVLFGGSLNKAADEVGVNVNVDTPKVEVPNVDINVPEKIEVDLPDVDTKDEPPANKQ